MDVSDITPVKSFQEKFEAKLTEYEQQHQGSQRKPWTTEKILEVMNSIRKARVAISSKQSRTTMDYYWKSKYDIIVIANEDHLIFKRKSPNDPTVRIIPRNEYFGILEETHIACGHGGRDKMIHAIKTRFYIPKKAIEIFLALCPTCETRKALPKKGIVSQPIVSYDLNIRGQADLLDFQSCPDGEYKWLLNYQDIASKFVSLRPLKTVRAQEVAMELMKIFTTFGAPYILQSDSGREFTAKIIEELTSIWPECKIVHGSPGYPQTGTVERSNQDVENMLRSWMNENNSINWSVGCYHVQYKKNASFHRIIGRSPYRALFGCDPKAGLSNSVIPSSILTNVETEEQLQNLSKQEFSSEINLLDSAIKPVNSEVEIEISEPVNRNSVVLDRIESETDTNSELEPCSSIAKQSKMTASTSTPAVTQADIDQNSVFTSTSNEEDVSATKLTAAGSGAPAQPDLNEDISCSACGGDIVGFRYTCVQCADYDLCATCEACDAHAEHYVLRIPAARPHVEIENVLHKIRSALKTEITAPSDNSIIQIEIKKEAEAESDQLQDPTVEVKTEPSEYAAEADIEMESISNAGIKPASAAKEPVKTPKKRPAPQKPRKADPKKAKESLVVSSRNEEGRSFAGSGSSVSSQEVMSAPGSLNSSGLVSEEFTFHIKLEPPERDKKWSSASEL